MSAKERGNRTLRLLDRWLGIPLILGIGLLRRRRSLPTEVRNIGLLLLGAIGDSLIASSLIEDLRCRYPETRIIGFISQANKGICDLLDGVDEFVLVPVLRPWTALCVVRQYPVDIILDFGQWARFNSFLCALGKAKFTVGLRKTGQYRHFAYDAVGEHRGDRHQLENYRDLARCLGITPRGLPRVRPSLTAKPLPVELVRPYIVFHPWASGYRHEMREWPRDCWVELAKALIAEGYQIVVSGGPSDRPGSLAIAETICHAAVHVLAGTTTLVQTATVLHHAAGAVTVNTGTMHLAAALDCPQVALHGPTNPVRWGPLSRHSVVVGPGAAKGGAYLDLGYEYPSNPKPIMDIIRVEDVLKALRPLLVTQDRL